MDVRRLPCDLGRLRSWAAVSVTLLALVVPLVQCSPAAFPTAETVLFSNTTAPTNNGATQVGSAACEACHATLAEALAAHRHSQCEACHGPGSNHVFDPQAYDLYVNNGPTACSACHVTDAAEPSVIGAADGFVSANAQWSELQASGGHSGFSCMYCHDPHTSTTQDRQNAIRNECTVCHFDANMAFHQDVTFIRGDYEEKMDCVSCHMPYAVRKTAEPGEPTVGTDPEHMGDARSHIFRINTENADYTLMFTADGTAVMTDRQGRAAVTLDFVCLRCHNAEGNASSLTVRGAATVAPDMHENVPASE
jgi:hypothetical protein